MGQLSWSDFMGGGAIVRVVVVPGESYSGEIING